MKYERICRGSFIKRLNRFVAEIEVNGITEICHVKNTGRLAELLIPGAEVFVEKSDNPLRKTGCDLISVVKNGKIYNIDSYAPNIVFGEFLKNGGLGFECDTILAEHKYMDSRFDFYFEHGGIYSYAEVKGVTLENNGIFLFPDAPTLRGLKHLNGLISAVNDGYEAYCIFVIQAQGATYFEPNRAAQLELADTMIRASDFGVRILAFECDVTQDEIKISQPVKIRL